MALEAIGLDVDSQNYSTPWAGLHLLSFFSKSICSKHGCEVLTGTIRYQKILKVWTDLSSDLPAIRSMQIARQLVTGKMADL